MAWLTAAISLGALLAFISRTFISSPKCSSLPPGPKTSWYGRVALPQKYPWLTYAQWRQVYGDVIYVYVFGNPIIVLNSATAASELLDKRSALYSSRPFRTMIVELIGWDWLFSTMAYGDRWKQHRNIFAKYFRQSFSTEHHPVQLIETHTLLRNLLHSPLEYRHHIRRTAAAIVLHVAYGHQVAEAGDEYVTIADKAMSSLAQAGIFGTYLVDYLPVLKYLPKWMPFHRQALIWGKSTREMVNRPFEMVTKKMREGTAESCMVTQELDSVSSSDDYDGERVIRNVAATTFAAGADTVVSTILSFFLVMTLYPEIQREAQREVGKIAENRLPTLADKNQLPYIESLCYELLRWNPVTPMGLAHYASQDDVYEGYRIPKGTTILPNVWGILHDPAVYPDPLKFEPTRFVNAEENKARGINPLPDVAFGFGRRMCPGRWFAFDSIWISVASILSVYNISQTIDKDGIPIIPEVDYTSALLSHPKPFPCQITPRSPEAMAMILETADHL